MKLQWESLGHLLVSTAQNCSREAIIVSPFMKIGALRRIVERLPVYTPVICVTRWRIEEIAIGISDLECWKLIAGRQSSRFLILSDLHAKYFRFDDTVFTGSANVTGAALGWNPAPNFECLMSYDVTEADVLRFERDLLCATSNVDEHVYSDFKNLLENYLASELAPPSKSEVDDSSAIQNYTFGGIWVPELRSPDYLFSVYLGGCELVSREGILTAVRDLRRLDLPSGLSEARFTLLVRSRLATQPLIILLDKFLNHERRFGEIRAWLADILNVSDATDEWQRLMRWLLIFFPDRYQMRTPNYSEIFSKL